MQADANFRLHSISNAHRQNYLDTTILLDLTRKGLGISSLSGSHSGCASNIRDGTLALGLSMSEESSELLLLC